MHEIACIALLDCAFSEEFPTDKFECKSTNYLSSLSIGWSYELLRFNICTEEKPFPNSCIVSSRCLFLVYAAFFFFFFDTNMEAIINYYSEITV